MEVFPYVRREGLGTAFFRERSRWPLIGGLCLSLSAAHCPRRNSRSPSVHPGQRRLPGCGILGGKIAGWPYGRHLRSRQRDRRSIGAGSGRGPDRRLAPCLAVAAVGVPGLTGNRGTSGSGRVVSGGGHAVGQASQTTMSRWFLVRHGVTDWNAVGRIQGQSDPPLNQAGHRQARGLGNRLAAVPFAAACSSDLRRASETAAAILQGEKSPAANDARPAGEALRSLGGTDLPSGGGPLSRPVSQQADDRRPFLRPAGGESDLDLYARAGAVADRLLQAHAGRGGNLLVVAHGGILRALIACLTGLPAPKMWGFRFANAGLSVVSFFDKDSAVLDRLNDTSHLGEGFGE